MSRTRTLLILVTSLVLLLAACGVSETPTSDPAIGEEVETQEEVPTEDVSEEAPTTPEIDPAAIFADRCARCHAADRSGDRGPALLPEELTQDASVYQATIMNGSGIMPSFSSRLSSEEISALVEFILSDPQ